MSGSFSKRLELFTPFGFASKPLDPENPPPAIEGGEGAPHVLLMKGVPVGIAHPMAGVALTTGSESQRLLAAVGDLIGELIHAKDQAVLLERLRELGEAYAIIGKHLDSAALAVEALPVPNKAVH